MASFVGRKTEGLESGGSAIDRPVDTLLKQNLKMSLQPEGQATTRASDDQTSDSRFPSIKFPNSD